jgi:two-component system response regulator HupR/HoxA
VGRPGPLANQVVADAPSLEVAWARDVDEALQLPLPAFDAVVIEAGPPEAASSALPKLAAVPDRPRLIALVTAVHATAREQLRGAGADEVVVVHQDRLSLADLERRTVRTTPGAVSRPHDGGIDGIVAESTAMRQTLALIERARGTQATVLLTGETGTGKEVLAHAIHRGSDRGAKDFVAVNCAAFPDTLLESELFGHVRGAFTGADRDKKGLFEEADGGVLFLDEVGETSAGLQAKLLRALQEREVRPVGGSRTRGVNVRLLAATNRDLQLEVRGGRFREDLFYRLAVFPVPVPPLRRRREDVLPLARHFLQQIGRGERKPGCRLSREAEELLVAHAWPGNVRELENEMQRCVALAEPGAVISPALLSERIAGALQPLSAASRRGETLREALERVEAWLIRRCLTQNDGRRTVTARQLGVTREGLYKKMKRLGID